MFVRNVSIKLKPDTSTEFAKTFESEILPLLRKQSGFQNEITYSNDKTYVNAVSIWDSKQSADTYDKNAYPQVLKAVEKFIDGEPKVRTGEVLSSTVASSAATAHVA
jgi:heme-degrading monooxygenase HmoA